MITPILDMDICHANVDEKCGNKNDDLAEEYNHSTKNHSHERTVTTGNVTTMENQIANLINKVIALSKHIK